MVAPEVFSGLKAQYSNHINYGALFQYIGGDRDNRNPKPSACKADALPLELYPQTWCWQRDSNSQPTVYKTVALPLCYASVTSICTISTYKSIGKMVDRARIELAIESYQDPVIPFNYRSIIFQGKT